MTYRFFEVVLATIIGASEASRTYGTQNFLETRVLETFRPAGTSEFLQHQVCPYIMEGSPSFYLESFRV